MKNSGEATLPIACHTDAITSSPFAAPRRDAAPSRYDNPFATCWTRPGALAYHFSDGESLESLVARLAAQNWWGAIVGPHGSGKSTLLESLQPALRDAGYEIYSVVFHAGQGCLPPGFFSANRRKAIVIVDGYEQLTWLMRRRLARRCRSARLGLLVTSHEPAGIPTVIRLAPNLDLVQQLVAELTTQVSTQITEKDVTASHACHGSNVRECFFELYDRHERLRRRGQ